MVNALLMIAVGVYFSMVGFGKLRISKNAEKEKQWRRRWEGFIKVAGVVLIGIGAILLMTSQR